MPKIREMGLFHFPKFRITCIIRNNYNQKREAALLSCGQISGSFCGCFSVCARRFYTAGPYYQYVQAFNFLPAVAVLVRYRSCLYKQYRFFCFGDAMLIPSAAVLYRSMHRWLRNKCVPQSYSPVHCQSAPHPRCSLQSTALPTLPDNPHPPAA